MSYGVGHKHGLDLMLLWLWCGPAAVAPFGPLAWEAPYAMSVAQKSKKKSSFFPLLLYLNPTGARHLGLDSRTKA